jgi:hypothetical protein
LQVGDLPLQHILEASLGEHKIQWCRIANS